MSKNIQHSRYWLDDELFDQDSSADSPTEEGLDLGKIARLAAVRRAIGNFVTILSGQNIPVQYSSGKQSYTDGETVVISADDDPERFDVMVGLALHEGSHVLLTDFSVLKYLAEVRGDLAVKRVPRAWASTYVGNTENILDTILPQALVHALPKLPNIPYNYMDPYSIDAWAHSPYYEVAVQMLDDIKMLMNILEDRRIDKYVYQHAMGYRPYYDALYARYFFTAEVGRNLRFNPQWREVTVENYLNRLLFAFHPDAKPDALPGLQQLIDLMDIQTIERLAPGKPRTEAVTCFDHMPALWREACTLYAHILRYAELAAPAESPHPVIKMMPEEGKESLKGLPNLDGAPSTPGEMVPQPVEKDTKGKGKKMQEVDGKYNEKKAAKEIDTAKKAMAGETRKKKLKKAEQEAVEALEAADAQMVDLKGDGVPFGRCMVLRKINDQLLGQDWYIFKRYDWQSEYKRDAAEKSIAAGKRMGQILVHRLQVRNDPMLTKQTRLPHGGLDRRLLAQLGMDITSVFQKSRVDIHKPAMLHLTLDASGSMSGRKWDKVRTVAVALAFVGSKLRNVDTVISIRGGNDTPMVSVIFDSRKDQFPRFIKYVRRIEPNGATPEGLCFKATMSLITECAATHDVYFINFSDGEPSFSYTDRTKRKRRHYGYYDGYFSYSGDVAFKHTRAMVNQMREAGVKVLSYFISENTRYNTQYGGSDAFRRMYGEDASFVNVENAAEVIRTLNKLLLTRGA